MQIIAHRGYWNETVYNNSPAALRLALENGFGFESDIRDYEGELVISHDIATERSQKAAEVFQWLAEFHDKYCFAVNIKADGVGNLLKEQLKNSHISNYFTFDMSVPQMVDYAQQGIVFFTRQSEYEREPVLYDQAAGVWIDGFEDISWITEALMQKHIAAGKKICLVSPELHGRHYTEFWASLQSWDLDYNKVFLCTDFPEEARTTFLKYM